MKKKLFSRVTFVGLAVLSAAGAIGAPAAGDQDPRARVGGFVTGPPTSSHSVAGPVPKGWLQVVNYYRGLADLPPVTENPTSSSRNAKHARYMVKNQAVTHFEVPGNPAYSEAGHIGAQRSNLTRGDWGQTERTSIETWMLAPFHGIGIIDPRLTKSGYADYQETRPPGQFPYAAALDVITNASGPGSWPVMFPSDNSKIYLNAFKTGEHPNPLASCSGYTMPTGPPIYLLVNSDPATVSSSFSSEGNFLPYCIFHEGNYTNPNPDDQALGRSVLGARNAIILMPKNPLEQGKTYDVSITVNGTPHMWSFEVGDVTPPTTKINHPTSGGQFDQDTFRKIRGKGFGNPARVEVELYRDFGNGLCTFWLGNKFSDKRACNQPKWLKADGTDNWSLSVPKLPAKSYVVHSRGIDRIGNTETYSGFNFLGFSLKR